MPTRFTPEQIESLLAKSLGRAKKPGGAWHQKFNRSPASERTDVETGRVVHSKDELRRLRVLRNARDMGLIRNLRHQVRYPIECLSLGPLRIVGESGARRAFYTADFVYEERDARSGEWQEVIEEFKRFDDPFSRWRRAVFSWVYQKPVRLTGNPRSVKKRRR